MLISYPALFYYNENDGYYVYFPDIEGSGTQGEDITDAMNMASDYLGIMCADFIETGVELPKISNIKDISLENNFPFSDDEDFRDYYDLDKSFISLVLVDINEYLQNQELVKKTLSIPKWANDLGNRLGINFSSLLTESIANLSINR